MKVALAILTHGNSGVANGTNLYIKMQAQRLDQNHGYELVQQPQPLIHLPRIIKY